MRLAARSGLRSVCRGLVALGLVALAAGNASAQLVFDGNLLFNNNASGTLVGQFSGTAGVGAPSCPGGTTAATLGTVTYVHNAYDDPLLTGGIYPLNNFQPAGGSPAFTSAVSVPADGFFKQVCFKGGIGPNLGDDWTQGWTYYDSTGASRQDLHLVGMPDPRPLAVYNNVSITGHAFWSPDSNYEVRGQLRIKNGGQLTVAPGVVILEDVATLGTIIAERGGRIYAVGNACAPIIITSNAPPGSQLRGDVGGIFLNGRAKTNVVNSCAGDSAASEGGAIGFYGGNDDEDCSGALRYVRVEYAGKQITTNNELNSFTWNACGRGTRGDFLQAFRGADDGFEWFGGAMDQKYLIAIDGTDDGIDSQLGSRNRLQFAVVRVAPNQAPALTQFGERGIEADNNEFNFDQVQCAGRSNMTVANVTFIGDKRSGPTLPGSTQGVQWRRGTGYTLLNSIVYNFKTAGLAISDDATWEAHCVAAPAAPAVFCGPLGVRPISEGNVFVARSQPNPFRNQVNISFALPQAGPVSVEIYGADGRHVRSLANREMAAGPHTLTWSIEDGIPSGIYFYRVLASGQTSTGKITHLD
ncbi:MAG: T9SS type A sorting domain-containing protein [Candidatus Eisenbacteria bacterium]|uniref:T9SS type A sorting domain-containing protein n=1 Tax=Eiseniibacteriota bacterium TaxID=2212470 RepID=A0A849SHD3_UNCEI|nr:T9SS type A sorting domain-containing protein [Candidatus Eisenbacteria bacterium]